MITQVCAVRDVKTEMFSQPLFYVTKGVAVRSFADEVQREGSEIGMHPEDYALFYLGTYNDETGAFEGVPQPAQLALAMDNKKV